MKLARMLRPHPRMHAFMERGWRQGEGDGGGKATNCRPKWLAARPPFRPDR